MPSQAFAERILKFVQAKGYKPQQVHELAEAMGIGEDEHGDFHAACKALMKTGRIVLGSRNALMLPPPPGKIVGTFRGNPRGFGFIVPDTPNAHGDLYVPAPATGGAITGDTVSARVVKRGRRGGKMLYEGRGLEILKRGQSRFVGELRREVGRWFVVPDGNTLHVPIMVGDPGAKNAQAGDQVVVELTRYPEAERPEARGAIVKILGPRGKPGVDALSIIEQFQLLVEFDEEVLEAARAVTAAYDPKTAVREREDLRKETIITIDPPDARDFDDAISVTRNRDGTMELGVHIADVAHFVQEGGVLDVEAQGRSTSVYLGRTVIPMLPELLSNGVCSLQERQTRLTKSVFVTYDRRGKVKRARVANSVIRSTKRLSYPQVTKILEGQAGRVSAKVVALLADMEKLARLIRRRRLGEGMLVLDLPEVELVYDDEGAVCDVKPADTGFSHTIIEMFMVEANEAVARLLADQKVPFLRRIHDEPRELTKGELRQFLGALGHVLPAEADRFALQALLDRTRGRNEAYAVHLAILRSMQQAEYSPLAMGHYALASDNYCHFTSPIRRYPDLTVHRLLEAYVRGTFDVAEGRRHVPTGERVQELGNLCSTSERRAEAAERELKMVGVLRLLQERLGDAFGGVVTGVANVGIFVQLDRYLAEGLLRFDHLFDDWWEVDASVGSVIGERSGYRITVGDRLRVVITRVHLPTRRLELALAEPPAEGTPSRCRERAHGRGKGQRRSPGRERARRTRRPRRR